MPQPITIDDALAWFELDKATVDETKIRAAFRHLAKKYHPDTRGNYKEKLAASENFIAASSAKDMLIEACRKGTIPVGARPASTYDKSAYYKHTKSTDRRQYSSDRENNNSKNYSDYLSGRQKYDYHNPLLTSQIMEVKYIGKIFVSILAISGIVAISTGLVGLFPILISYPFIRNYINEQKLQDSLSGLPLFAVYFISTFVGSYFYSKGSNDIFILLLATSWFFVAMMTLDELYSLARYKLRSRKIKKELSIILSEEAS